MSYDLSIYEEAVACVDEKEKEIDGWAEKALRLEAEVKLARERLGPAGWLILVEHNNQKTEIERLKQELHRLPPELEDAQTRAGLAERKLEIANQKFAIAVEHITNIADFNIEPNHACWPNSDYMANAREILSKIAALDRQSTEETCVK